MTMNKTCPRCSQPQLLGAYCVEWTDGTCIRMESVHVMPKDHA